MREHILQDNLWIVLEPSGKFVPVSINDGCKFNVAEVVRALFSFNHWAFDHIALHLEWFIEYLVKRTIDL